MPKTNGHSLPVGGKPRGSKKQPTREEVQLRAYQIYLERGGAPGDPMQDWLRAESELLHKNGKTTRAARAIKAKAS